MFEFLANFGVYPAVFLAAVLAFVIGFIWHGPLFGRQWASLVGFSKKEMKAAKEKGMKQSMFVHFVTNIMMAFALLFVVLLTNPLSYLEVSFTAFWIWLGFVATVQLAPVIWENKPFKLYLINTGYYLVSFVAMANFMYFYFMHFYMLA